MTRIINFSGKFWNRIVATRLKLFITMIFSYIKDSLLNVVLPLCIGAFIYFAGTLIPIPVIVKNFAPDALWAYALASSLLIAWDRTLHFGWLISGGILLISIELLQFFRIIQGRADYIDIIVYLIAYSLAVILNPFFKKRTHDEK